MERTRFPQVTTPAGPNVHLDNPLPLLSSLQNVGVLSVGGGRLGADQGEGSGRLRSGVAVRQRPNRAAAQKVCAELGRTEGVGALGGSKTYPYGSTSTVAQPRSGRARVLKVATADQIRRLTCPGHKANKAVRNACWTCQARTDPF
ncbi:hypothetical protein E4K10_13415 [Streptomyces sp. T1317-0309]|nr:hypothetical protein E4K10_13415 [Streptomyces sp. T1317-0309]